MCSARTTGAASATGSAVMSTQRMRGSRRNHRSWRTANCRVCSTISSDRGVQRTIAVEMSNQLLVAQRLASGARQRLAGAGEAVAPRRAGPSSSSRALVVRCVDARPRRDQRRPICGVAIGGYELVPGPKLLNGRPLPRHTSSARTTRRPLLGSILAAADRIEYGQAPMQRGDALAAVSFGLEFGADLGPLPRQAQ